MIVNLHFGMHRDAQVIHEAVQSRLIDGLIVPMHIMLHQRASTAVFVASVSPHIPYIIDPATCRLQSPLRKHLNTKQEGLRASTLKLCDMIHPDLAAALMATDQIAVEDMPDAAEITATVVAFQKTAVGEGSEMSAAKKYFDRYGIATVNAPRAILPPYFRFEVPGDAWYEYSLSCALSALEHADQPDKIAAVVYCPVTALRDSTIRKIHDDYGQFKTIILWVDDYHETYALPRDIRIVRSAIRQLGSDGNRIEALYGGYLLLLSEHDGLSALGHGILFTQHKSSDISGAGEGGAADRYYIPAFHQFRSLSQTDLILHKHPELMCACEVCTETMRGDPDRFIAYQNNPDLLRMHFLRVREEESERMSASTLPQHAAALLATHARYDASLRTFRNPDALVQGGPMQGLTHLKNWAEGISA